MTYVESIKVLNQLEDLLHRQLLDTTDPETLALIEEISAEVSAIKRRIKSVDSI